MGVFSSKKREQGPGLWEAVDKKQREYAHRLADWLGGRAARVPVRRLRVWVIVILVGMALLNTANIIVAIHGRHDKAAPGLGFIQPAAIPDRGRGRSFRGRRSLEMYLDSLRRDSTGSRLLDSLLKVRPGLADSLNQAERLER